MSCEPPYWGPISGQNFYRCASCGQWWCWHQDADWYRISFATMLLFAPHVVWKNWKHRWKLWNARRLRRKAHRDR